MFHRDTRKRHNLPSVDVRFRDRMESIILFQRPGEGSVLKNSKLILVQNEIFLLILLWEGTQRSLMICNEAYESREKQIITPIA